MTNDPSRSARAAIGITAAASLAAAGAGPGQALAAPESAAQVLLPAAAASPVVVRVGQAQDFSRVEFAGRQPLTVRRDGRDLVFSLPDVAPPNLALLRASPPRYVTTAALRRTGGGWDLRITLAEGVEARVGRADGVVYANLKPGAATPPGKDQTPLRTGDPVPASGVVRARAGLDEGVLSLRFDWRRPVGAAVFRRGPAIWLVFDAKARLDTSELPDSLPQARALEVVNSDTATVLRIVAPEGVQASASASGSSWTLSLAANPLPQPTPVEVHAADGALSAQLAGATGVFWLDDPSVGDQLAVVTALGPSKGALEGRRLVDADVLASAQGLALAPRRQDLSVASDGDVVRIGRPSGLALSDGGPGAPVVRPPPSLPQPADMPGLIDFEGWSATGPHGFLARYDALLGLAGAEGAQGKGASVQARLGLARFLVGSELGFEAIGVLDLLAKADPQTAATAEFRGLRAAARVLAGRYKDAQADLSAPVLADDPAASLWRGYAAMRLGDAAGARQAFQAGAGAFGRFSPRWRERFLDAQGEASLAAHDLAAARSALNAAQDLAPAGADHDRLRLDLGRLADASGQPAEALPLYAEAQASDDGGVAARGLLYATEIEEGQGRITPDQAAAALLSVRYRWRGDGVELEAARAQARLYVAQGRYREGLQALKAVQNVSPDLPEAAGVQGDLTQAFHALFIDGGADGLAPLQALSLFQDFKDLTPIGADGDALVRRLARRLVDVDLLDQAADLLKYQADNRLDGVARADVDTELATIQVMNRRPEQALDALAASRTTLLPSALQSQRRAIQARALTALGRYDDALEVLDADVTADAQAARADALWRKRDWPAVGRLLEVSLGQRFRRGGEPLSGVEQSELLRAAIAYSLAGDDAGVTRLRGRYAGFVAAAREPDMLRLALSGSKPDDPGAGPAAKLGSDAGGFDAWVAATKARLLGGASRPA